MKSLASHLTHGRTRSEGLPEPGQHPKRLRLGANLQTPSEVKKILLADDDPGIREMLGRVLKAEGYQVLYAKDGNEAATKSLALQPDLILLDLNMPARDGWSAFRLVNSVHPLLPVIVITARSNQYAVANELGIDALMEKPLNLPVLLESIAGFVAETEAERTRRLTNPQFKMAYLNQQNSPKT